jgi:hypothetical protein
MTRNEHRSLILYAALGAFALTGCAQEQPFTEEPVKANLRTIHKAYWMIEGYYNRPPRDMEELRQSIADLHALEMGGPTEEVLVSPRDNKPFVIILGKKRLPDVAGLILAYEEQGAGNTRYIVTSRGDILELSNEEFGKAKFAQDHKPSA